MSYILDALKKSEEERHQGQVPNLGSNSSLIHSTHSKSILWPWLVAALLVLNIAVVAYWMLSNHAVSEQPLAHPLDDSLALAPVSDSATETLGRVDLPSNSAPVKNEGYKSVELSANSVSAVNTKFDEAKIVETKFLETKPLETGIIDEEPAVVLDQSSDIRGNQYDSQSENNRVDQAAAEDRAFVNYEPMLITPKGKSRIYTGPAVTQADAFPVEYQSEYRRDESEKSVQTASLDLTTIQRISDKPHSFQLQIPDMAFNSHIYTDSPSSRRVMINNIYLREGQSFSGLKVDQITEEGVVLSLDGEAFKMGVLRDWYSPR